MSSTYLVKFIHCYVTKGANYEFWPHLISLPHRRCLFFHESYLTRTKDNRARIARWKTAHKLRVMFILWKRAPYSQTAILSILLKFIERLSLPVRFREASVPK